MPTSTLSYKFKVKKPTIIQQVKTCNFAGCNSCKGKYQIKEFCILISFQMANYKTLVRKRPF